MKFFISLIFSINLLYQFQSTKNKCNIQLAETIGVISNKEPTKESLILCPKTEASCCPAYEQYKLFKIIEEEVKPHIKVYNQLLKK